MDNMRNLQKKALLADKSGTFFGPFEVINGLQEAISTLPESAMAAIAPQESASKVSNPELSNMNAADCIEAQIPCPYVKGKSLTLQLMANLLSTLGSLLEPSKVEEHTEWVEVKFLRSNEDQSESHS